MGKVGVEAIRSWVANGGGYLGICAGANLAVKKEYLHLSAFTLAPWPHDVKVGKDGEGLRGEGPVMLTVSNDTMVADALEAFGISRPSVQGHAWDYCSGPVLELPYEPFDLQFARMVDFPIEPLLYFATTAPTKNYDHTPIDFKQRNNAEVGKVALGFNAYGKGKVMVGGPHWEVKTSGQLPGAESMEGRLMDFMVRYVGPDCQGPSWFMLDEQHPTRTVLRWVALLGFVVLCGVVLYVYLGNKSRESEEATGSEMTKLAKNKPEKLNQYGSLHIERF
eukprot:TRINITY_DN2311_c0_g1_i3.p1 TRINITY_DN2311_c0_g1~~TRINITY_DN2311_c0_g1_i3.p1  ORF type:complete len:278 (-),score=46.95 TRINITY_DN2311_c0_g1_i3:460-1293(-)